MYTHHWAYQPSHPRYAQAWPSLLDDTRRIIDRVRHAGMVIAGPDGYRRPILDPVDCIAFNGDATSDLDGDPFTLLAPLPTVPRGRPTATAACRTGRKPYDLAVAAVLLRCALLLPEVFAVASDGGWDSDWARGATAGYPAAAPWRRLGARAVVAQLFGTNPIGSPLRRGPSDLRLADPPR